MKSVAYSQPLRLSLTCLEEKDFDKHLSEMKFRFLRTGCRQKLIETETKKVRLLD